MKKMLLILTLSIFLIGCSPKDHEKNQTSESPNPNENAQNIEETPTAEATLQPEETSQEVNEDIQFYMGKLKDKSFVSTYGDEEEPSTWYTAAEELGAIGKPAIPFLIDNLNTTDTYEKGLTLYALLLASQDEQLKEITKGEYIETGLTFNPEEQIAFTTIARTWWNKYKDNF